MINAADAAAISSRKAMKPEFVAMLKDIFKSIEFNAEQGLFQTTVTLNLAYGKDLVSILEHLGYEIIAPDRVPSKTTMVVVTLSWKGKADVYQWEVLREALNA